MVFITANASAGNALKRAGHREIDFQTRWIDGQTVEEVRRDGLKGFFLRAGIGEFWIDFDSANSVPGFNIIKLDIGSMF